MSSAKIRAIDNTHSKVYIHHGGFSGNGSDTDAPDTSLATGQPTADIDAAHTHFTHTHVTRTHTQDARKAAEGPVHLTNAKPIPPLTRLSSLPLLTN